MAHSYVWTIAHIQDIPKWQKTNVPYILAHTIFDQIMVHISRSSLQLRKQETLYIGTHPRIFPIMVEINKIPILTSIYILPQIMARVLKILSKMA